jgi:hypothetical protein
MTESQGTPSLVGFINTMLGQKIAEIHTALPGQVVAYYPEKDMADIQPCLQRKFSDGTTEPLPIMRNVKIIWPRTAKASIKFPIAKDDYVLLFAIERSIDLFRGKGGLVDPADTRKHSLSDCVCMPGFWPDADVVTAEANALEMKNDVAMVRLMPDGKTYVGKAGATPSEPVPLGNVTKEYLETLHEKISAILDMLIAGDFVLTTGAGSPTAPNPAKALDLTQLQTDLEQLKSDKISNDAFLSDLFFTEKGE